LSSNVLKPSAPQGQAGEEEDDEFDFEVSQSKTFVLPPSLQTFSSSELSGLKLTTLGGKGGPDVDLDGENSEDDSSSETQQHEEQDQQETMGTEQSAEESPPVAAAEAPLSTRDAARLALAEITGIYSSGLGDHEVTILNSSSQQSGAGAGEMSSKELSLMAKLGIKDSAIEEVDEEELERTEEREVQLEQEHLYQQEQQKNELESQWAAVESNHVTSPFSLEMELEGDEESRKEINYEIVTYKEALALFRGLDLSEHRSSIVIDEPTESSWNPLRGDSSLSKANLPRNEIEFPFLVAQVDYAPVPYLPLLRTLFKVPPLPSTPSPP
jgi:hypothetical protein